MPKRIGKYQLDKTLGSGAFSKVKLGIDTETAKHYAIKIIDKEQLQREHMEEQLKREIAVMKLLDHENVVKLFEVLQTQRHIYLVLELVTGGELFDRIVAAKRFDEKTARNFFQQLILGLYYCHTQQVAHRDLKPENLLLDGRDNLKITDFGLSNLQRGALSDPKGGGAMLQTVCGTPNYVAPEVLKEAGYNGITADIWSCGVILFVMLAGYLPFDDQNMNALFNKIERGDYRMARHFSEPVRDIISKMLQVDPANRCTMEEILAHRWFQEGGFNTAKVEAFRGCTKVKPNDQQVRDWATDTKESGDKDKGPNAKEATPQIAGMNAFQIISALTQGTLQALTLQEQKVSIKRSTRFITCKSTEDSLKCIVAILNEMKANPKPSKQNPSEMKGFVNASKGMLTYAILASATVSPSLSLIEMRRTRGDTFDFHQLYREVTSKLEEQGVVVSRDRLSNAAEGDEGDTGGGSPTEAPQHPNGNGNGGDVSPSSAPPAKADPANNPPSDDQAPSATPAVPAPPAKSDAAATPADAPPQAEGAPAPLPNGAPAEPVESQP